MTVVAGDYEPGAYIIVGPKGTSAAIALGDVVELDTSNNVWKTAPATANQKGPFGVAVKAAATADTTVSVLREGRVYVKTSGTIHPVRYVQADSANAGQVVEYVPITIATTPLQADVQAARDEFSRIVGMYEGHENEGDGKTVPTNTTTNDIIRVDFGIGG